MLRRAFATLLVVSLIVSRLAASSDDDDDDDGSVPAAVAADPYRPEWLAERGATLLDLALVLDGALEPSRIQRLGAGKVMVRPRCAPATCEAAELPLDMVAQRAAEPHFVALHNSKTKHLVVAIATGPETATRRVLDVTPAGMPFPNEALTAERFQRQWASIRSEVMSVVRNQPTAELVTFVGHDDGGAVALLAAADLAIMLKSRSFSAVTFGSPSLGNDVWSQVAEKHITHLQRVILACDMCLRTATSTKEEAGCEDPVPAATDAEKGELLAHVGNKSKVTKLVFNTKTKRFNGGAFHAQLHTLRNYQTALRNHDQVSPGGPKLRRPVGDL